MKINTKITNLTNVALAKMSTLSYPVAILLNNYSMTLLLVVVGIDNQQVSAAHIGVVQASGLATFFVFSANARNLILSEHNELNAYSIFSVRLLIIVPLIIVASILSVSIGGVPFFLGLVLVARKAFEWIADITISYLEREGNLKKVQLGVAFELFTLICALIMILFLNCELMWSVALWALSPLIPILYAKELIRNVTPMRCSYFGKLLPHLGSTAIIGLSVYVFRFLIITLTGDAKAGELFTAFAIGGIIPAIFGQAIAPTLVRKRGGVLIHTVWFKIITVLMSLILILGLFIYYASAKYAYIYGHVSTFWAATGLSVIGGALMTYTLLLRAYIINSFNQRVFFADLIANLIIMLSVPITYFWLGGDYMSGLYLLSALLNFACLVWVYRQCMNY